MSLDSRRGYEMEGPKIEWYSRVGTDAKYAPDNNVYAGTYTKKHPLVIYLQLWNNRWGTEDVESLDNFYINMFFKHKEDSVLLEHCTVILNDSEVLNLNRSGDLATLEFPRAISLSGTKNDGSSKNNADHFLTLQLTFDAGDAELKENDLKSLFFDIVKNE